MQRERERENRAKTLERDRMRDKRDENHEESVEWEQMRRGKNGRKEVGEIEVAER